MKKLLYIVLISVLGASAVSAQASHGLFTTSSATVGKTIVHHSQSATGLPTPQFTTTSYYSNRGTIHTSDMRVRDYYAYSGSKYSSNITAVGETLFKDSYEGSVHRRRVDDNPEIPFPDPVGEIPFVLMAVLAAGYIALRKWRKTREQRHSTCAANNE